MLLLAGLAPATSGCIAAAIPLAAGGLVAKRMTSGEHGGTPTPARVAKAPAPVAQASAASDVKVTRLALAELPPPDPVTVPGNPAITAFRTYALAETEKTPSPGRRPSALLSRASDLRADRATCTASSLAVFVDLDPGRGTFDPLAPGEPDLAMAAALSDLRSRGVEVVWFSRLGTGFEDATRAALATSGLDPARQDRLVMLGSLEERKQSRRDEIAKTVCPIALMGDERADFDELYLYLKQPDAAVALDAMIGRGWFLASPFVPGGMTKDPTP